MNWNVTEEVVKLLDSAVAAPWLPGLDRSCPPVMRRSEIEKILPHREPFLFLDDILRLDLEEGLIAARYDLDRGQVFLAGHFPNDPLWPGIFQIEALNQAGGIVFNRRHDVDDSGVLTNVLAARFMSKVVPRADVYVIVRVLEFGQMYDAIGQTIQNGKLCSAAATRIYSLSEDL